ncbi:MAG: hypothetical protein ACXAEN_25205 [Candidatus Thorarchaeota archaeon]|jgi:hypothetical protein
MKTGTAEVTSESQTLGECEFTIYETGPEALESLGEEKLLDILNAQIKTNAMNQFRTAKTKGPTKSWLRGEAFNEIIMEVKQGQHEETLGDKNAMEALVQKRMGEIEERMKVAAATEPGSED